MERKSIVKYIEIYILVCVCSKYMYRNSTRTLMHQGIAAAGTIQLRL